MLQIKPSGWAWSDLATVDGAGLTMVDYTPMVDLTANTLYQWRVNACNDLEPAQCSGFSKPRKFKTAP